MPKIEYGYITQEEQKVGTETQSVVLKEKALVMKGRGGAATKRFVIHRPSDLDDLESNTLDHQAVLASKRSRLGNQELIDRAIGPICDIIGVADEARARAICIQPVTHFTASGEGVKLPKKDPKMAKKEDKETFCPEIWKDQLLQWTDPYSVCGTSSPSSNEWWALAYFDVGRARPASVTRIIDDMAIELIRRYTKGGNPKASAATSP